jgi:hypothetical protein
LEAPTQTRTNIKAIRNGIMVAVGCEMARGGRKFFGNFTNLCLPYSN